jgi:hypothetical protein
MNTRMPLPNWATICIGIACIAIGLFGKKFYGPGNPASFRLGDPVPKWFGRIGFIAFGLFFLWLGIFKPFE